MEVPIGEALISEKEYLDGELVSGVKHEFIAGRVYAMSGGSLNHQTVALNFLRHSGNQLAGKPCRPTGSDFKVRIPLEDDAAYYYPDGMILCEPVDGGAQYTDAPAVILEVISPSTRRNDEVQKLRDYLTLASLGVYLLAECDDSRLTLYRRDGEGFRREVLGGLDSVLKLPEVGVEIPFVELYRDVDLGV